MTATNKATTIYISSSSDDEATRPPTKKITVLGAKNRRVRIVGVKNQKKMNNNDNNNIVSKIKAEKTTNGTYICCSSDEDSDDDCVVLNFDPFESIDVSRKLSINDAHNDQDRDRDLFVVAEKRQLIACRDYPHSRHLCAKYPFNKTPHQTHCEQCYCYVCDVVAPCKFWSEVPLEHCNASDADPKWKTFRQSRNVLAK